MRGLGRGIARPTNDSEEDSEEASRALAALGCERAFFPGGRWVGVGVGACRAGRRQGVALYIRLTSAAAVAAGVDGHVCEVQLVPLAFAAGLQVPPPDGIEGEGGGGGRWMVRGGAWAH